MLLRLFNNRSKRKIASVLLLIMGFELISPNLAHALTSGPVQPEARGFEPVGTTDMVDPFTGDFVYNIPLMDVEGYPINISYHGGVGMEDEASWVGLGWNITPGAVNRGLRGLPDEFSGDIIEKEMYLKPDTTIKVGLAAGVEAFGVGDPYVNVGGSLGGYLTLSNYKGVSVDFTASAGINLTFGPLNAGVNTGASVGSQTGAEINYGANVGLGISRKAGDDLNVGGSFNLNAGGNYSPRTGLKQNVGFGVGISMSNSKTGQSASLSTGTSVPIGMQNYTAAITNPSYMNSYSGQLKLGGELWGLYVNGKITGSLSTTRFEPNGSRRGYGYFNLSEADDSSLVDFAREKDGMYNPTMSLLPQTTMTYDVYSVSGQGTGGSFRPFRNDIGSAYDPRVGSTSNSEDGDIEAGLGNLFSLGGEFKKTDAKSESGPWDAYYRPFSLKPGGPKQLGPKENIYFKEAGELTENNETYLNNIGSTAVTDPKNIANIPLEKPNSGSRVIRANHIYTLTGSTLDTSAILDSKRLISYDDTTGFRKYPTVNKTVISRVDDDKAKKLKRTTQQVTEIIQTQKDGRRYIYGLPVINNVQREATFAIKNNIVDSAAKASYIVNYSPRVDDKAQNGNGLDNFYSSTVTPSYVSAHLLTAVLSNDYVDVTGDGITDDDLGSYTKFNYSRKSNDYRWRSPAQSGKAQYIPGYATDKYDDKAAYIAGSREQWMLHSVETRNYVAEFYVSKRQDAKGVLDQILSGNGLVYSQTPYDSIGRAEKNYSYKLDSIVLYNKHDRFINGPGAQPIKTVLFTYDYSLCQGAPNAVTGKLTLKKIQIKYGSSNINMSAAYTFGYTNNYSYDPAAKDRWGNYKPVGAGMNNYEFPFTDQSAATNDYAKAWSLSTIALPSGGVINVDYESDDYGYVQDKEAMEMFKVAGIGNSPTFTAGSQLYFSSKQPNLYIYFTRRQSSENPLIRFRENYLKGTDLVYFNVATELTNGKYEPIKGYAEIDTVGRCADSIHGYVRMKVQDLTGTNAKSSPIVYAALNVGRYNLPQVMYPGSNPDASNMDNVVAGLKGGVGELFNIGRNPLQYYMDLHRAKNADLSKAFIRLTSPGLMKKGGGQRVKSVKFFDNWAAMTRGNSATYGKEYFYTMQREDGKGIISSGVASWEPSSGGDEIPQRVPVKYSAIGGTKFPPNDPIDLYQEKPIGESFFPSPVVGYRKVTSRSINIDKGRSSQSEDINYFYTAKEYPTQTFDNSINKGDPVVKFSLKDITISNEVTQGFSIVLNDMHGKPLNTEHWVLKTDTTTKARELISYQRNEYLTQGGQLSNMVPAFNYDAGAGQLNVVKKKMGIENDISIDSRMLTEESKTWDISANLNGFYVPPVFFAAIPLAYGFPFGNKSIFKAATVTKVTQQYGVLSDVTHYNEGATTRLHNEVFDAQTGNALVTSLNNEFGDREYTVSYPAYWAYKEMGPSYENHNVWDALTNPLIIDSFGIYSTRFVNYNPAYSSHYDLPSNMPVGRTIVDEQMPKFKLGDELLMYLSGTTQPPVRVWVMGYTSDVNHCYAVFATREPYEIEGSWAMGNTFTTPVLYRVVRSGNRNRLGETIQKFTTTDSNNIFPYLKNNFSGLISLQAQRYNHNLNQVYAANVVSDSLNPFVTGKVGTYRPEMEVVNLKKRDYVGGTTRKAGTFASTAYWKTEKDIFPAYCPDSTIREGNRQDTTYYVPPGTVTTYHNILDSLRLTYLGGDSILVSYYKAPAFNGSPRIFQFGGWGAWNNQHPNYMLYSGYSGFNPYGMSSAANSFIIHDKCLLQEAGSYMVYGYNINGNTNSTITPYSLATTNTTHAGEAMSIQDGSSIAVFYITYIGNGNFRIVRPQYALPGNSTNAQFTNVYTYSPSTLTYTGPTTTPGQTVTTYNGPSFPTPYRVRKKILLGNVGHYDGTDQENWIKTSQVSKYNWYGDEIETKEEGIGYNSATYGYNQNLPICVAKNAKHGEVLFDGFEDYAILRSIPNKREEYMKLFYSPIAPYMVNTNALGTQYKTSTLLPTGGMPFSVTTKDAHTGSYSIKTISNTTIPLNAGLSGLTDNYSFKMNGDRKYVASVWLKPVSGAGTVPSQGYNGSVSITLDTTFGSPSTALISASFAPKSTIIEGWQQYEVTFNAPANYKNFQLNLGGNFYYDDIRIYPFESNSKGFVYHPVTRKLIATLDENNYATFYEYDAEGNLIRTKRETENGILTISETRSTHSKIN